jgi:hypothetical protein
MNEAPQPAYPPSIYKRRRAKHLYPHATRAWWKAILGPELLINRSMRWLLPWDYGFYPGLQRGFLGLLNIPYTWSAVRHWRSGRAPVPRAVAIRLADVIEARSRAGLALVDELRAHADAEDARLVHRRGIAEVGPDGTDRRGGWRQRRATP